MNPRTEPLPTAGWITAALLQLDPERGADGRAAFTSVAHIRQPIGGPTALSAFQWVRGEL